MVISSAKFTILISWFPACIPIVYIPLVILSGLMKLESASIAIICNSIKTRHPWQTRIMVNPNLGAGGGGGVILPPVGFPLITQKR